MVKYNLNTHFLAKVETVSTNNLQIPGENKRTG